MYSGAIAGTGFTDIQCGSVTVAPVGSTATIDLGNGNAVFVPNGAEAFIEENVPGLGDVQVTNTTCAGPVAPGETCELATSYVATDADAGGVVTNTASADSDQVGPVTDTVETCNGCHVFDRNGNPSVERPGFFGSDGRSTFENEPQRHGTSRHSSNPSRSSVAA